FTQDANILEICLREIQRLVLAVFGLQDHTYWRSVKSLESHLAIDHHNGNLAVLHGRLLADEHQVAILDPGVDHAVAPHSKAEVDSDVPIDFDVVVMLLQR